MKQILDEAAKKGYGVPHFNVNNMEQAQAIMRAAEKVSSPAIIAASRGALKYSDLLFLRNIMMACAEKYPKIPLSLHLDHGNSLESAKTAISLGFTSVMIDGSLREDGKTPTTFDENVKVTRSVVEYAHALGVTVEGELGCLGGIEDGVGSGKAKLTNPDEVQKFLDLTGVDALAVAIGTSHGAYKFKGEAKLALPRIKEIKALTNTPLVLHGASTVLPSLIEKANKYGAQLEGVRGVPEESIKEAISYGINKINIDTDMRLAFTAAVREVLYTKPGEFDPRKVIGPARDLIREVVKGKMRLFGSSGKA